MRVLLVDSNQKFVDAIRESLIALEYTCMGVPPSNDLPAMLQGFPADVVFSGHCLPAIDGLKVLTAVRRALPASGVVIHSPRIDVSFACEAVSLRVFALVSETLELGGFVRLLDQWEQEASSLRERERQHACLALEFARLRTAYADLCRER